MRIRWFGAEPWNTTLCEDDYKIAVPVGSRCLECTKPIGTSDRGVVTDCSPRIWGHWRLRFENQLLSVGSYHLACFLAIVENGKIEGTRIAARAHGAQSTLVGTINTSVPDMTQPLLDLGVDDTTGPAEDAVPGRGWKR